MQMLRTILISLFILTFFLFQNVAELRGQTTEESINIDLEEIFAKNIDVNENEETGANNLLIHLYQNHISTQDGSNCVFHPSCSEFAKIVMDKSDNLKRSLLVITDRIQRCHISSFKTMQYEFDEKNLRLADPPDKYLKNN